MALWDQGSESSGQEAFEGPKFREGRTLIPLPAPPPSAQKIREESWCESD